MKVAVTGQMLQLGQVAMWSYATGTTTPWTFDLSVPIGTRDLFAFGESLVQVRRDLEIDAATTLPTIDLAADGVAYATSTITVANAEPDETIETSVSMSTRNGGATLSRVGTTLYKLPPSLLEPLEGQHATVEARTPTSFRYSQIPAGGEPVTFMPRLTDVTLGDLSASWVTLPEATDGIKLAEETATSIVSIDVTAQYLGGASAVAMSLDFRGYRDAWRGSDVQQRRFSVSDGANNFTMVFEGDVATREQRAFERPSSAQPITRFRPSRLAR